MRPGPTLGGPVDYRHSYFSACLFVSRFTEMTRSEFLRTEQNGSRRPSTPSLMKTPRAGYWKHLARNANIIVQANHLVPMVFQSQQGVLLAETGVTLSGNGDATPPTSTQSTIRESTSRAGTGGGADWVARGGGVPAGCGASRVQQMRPAADQGMSRRGAPYGRTLLDMTW